MSDKKPTIKLSLGDTQDKLNKLKPYSFAIFLVFLACIYGFVILRVSSLRDVQPSEEAVTSQVKAAKIPHIDESVILQLESLKDNSVSVQALFNDARSNPFQ